MAYNSRFLISPWVQVDHLASHLLGIMARDISKDWEAIYNHPVFFLETFVDTQRFLGTCYKAANWQYLGDTTGRGYPLSKKLPFIYESMKKPEHIKLKIEEIEALLEGVEKGHSQDGDYEIIKSTADTVIFLKHL